MNISQLPHTLLMIRPAAFGYNPETASTNVFQIKDQHEFVSIHKKALEEFDNMITMLSHHKIEVKVFQDNEVAAKPDAIFPNNWISFHENGHVVLYPMMAESRRKERRNDILEKLDSDFLIEKIIDLTLEEKSNKFLEGTGSLVFDHSNKIIYACLSPRTNKELVHMLATHLHYNAIIFNAYDEKGVPLYHTNVMLSIGKKFIVVCLDSVTSESDQEILLNSFALSNRKVIAISNQQMKAFACNLIEVQSSEQESFILISQSAFDSLLPGQIDAMTKHADILPVKINTIEKYGGGSVRCMIAGIHLPKRNSI